MKDDGKIKPCPFCGSSAVNLIEPSPGQFKVFCDNGGCSISTSIWGAVQPAIFAWNHRTDSAKIKSLIASTGEHITYRAEQQERIQKLEETLERLAGALEKWSVWIRIGIKNKSLAVSYLPPFDESNDALKSAATILAEIKRKK